MEKIGISQKIDNMPVDELLIRLNVMDKYKLAIMLGDLSNFESSNKKVSRVNTYDLTNGQKLFINCFVCNYNWYELSDEEKDTLFKYICSLISDVNNVKIILDKLGYKTEIVENEITAYW